ncbi:MAG TPA: DNA cytosine methyltransferase [Massilia sp.]|nr:DNA cytosine methyltransferase [Massilia sp.]
MKRDDFTLQLDLGHEIIADNFAGGGGASEALRQAFGREPDIAINHDDEALCMHAANHPTTAHYPEDVFLINPTKVTGNRPVGAAWFSPTCTHFSRAKGFNILNQKTRGLAWVVLKWGVQLSPRAMYLENVKEFVTWGPLDSNGRPIKALAGRTFKAFILALTTGLPEDHPDLAEIRETLGTDFPMERIHAGLGYKVEWKNLRACDYGAATIRDRLFMVMRRDGLPICWPAPTHAHPSSVEVKSGRLLPFATAANDAIDWSIPCPSIFGRKKPLVPATLRRVGVGFERYTLNSARPYIVGQGGSAYAGKPVSVDQPLGTLTTENHRAIVVPSLVQYYKGGGQNMPADGPMPTIVTKDRVGITCAYLAKHYTGVIGDSVDKPLPTITCTDHNSVVTAHLVGIDNRSNGARDTWPADAPAPTIVTENRIAVVTSNLVKLRGTSTAAAANEPLGAITAGGQHHAVVSTALARQALSEEGREEIRAFLREYVPCLRDVERPELVTIHGVVYEVVDIGLRMLTPRELANAQGFPPTYILNPVYTYTNARGKTVTKRLSGAAQVRMIGNSVSPHPAVALLRANNTHELQMPRAA